MARKYKGRVRTQKARKKKKKTKMRDKRKKVGGAGSSMRSVKTRDHTYGNDRPPLPPRDYEIEIPELIRKLNTRNNYCQYDKNKSMRLRDGEHGCKRRSPICMWGNKRRVERCMKNNNWLRQNTNRDSTLGIKGKYILKPDYSSNIGSSMGRVSSFDSDGSFDSNSSFDSEGTIHWDPDETENEDEEWLQAKERGKRRYGDSGSRSSFNSGSSFDSEMTIHWDPDETEDEDDEDDEDYSLQQRLPSELYLNPERETEDGNR